MKSENAETLKKYQKNAKPLSDAALNVLADHITSLLKPKIIEQNNIVEELKLQILFHKEDLVP
jgi:hypothetical protein